MVNVQKFLLENVDNEDGTYALVSYNGVVEPTWFSKYYDDESNKDCFLEYPCTLMKTPIEEDDIDTFCNNYVDALIILEEGETKEDFINKYMKHMIIGKWYYEIVNFQCMSYLPEEVDDIKLISERECLEYILEHNKEDDKTCSNEDNISIEDEILRLIEKNSKNN